MDAKTGKGSVQFGGNGKADVTLTLSDDDLVSLQMLSYFHFSTDYKSGGGAQILRNR